MKKETKNILIAGFTIGVVIIASIGLYSMYNKDNDSVVNSFGSLIKKVKKKHPRVYAWWDALSVENQILIEESMTPEFLTYLSKEFRKSALSVELSQRLAQMGYVG